jgi:Putative auto-transporter adhesin, head GIN domain
MKIERVLMYIFFIALAVWLFGKRGCNGCNFISKGVSGNGQVTSQNRELTAFSEVEVTAVIDVVLNQGEKSAVRIETDDNLQEIVKTEVSNGRLKISMPDRINVKNKVKLIAFVTVKTLDELKITGVCDVTCGSPLILDKFKFQFTGVGNAELKGSANEARFENTGVGDLNALEFICQKLITQNTGVGDLKCRAEVELSLENTGVGDIEYTGNASIKAISSTGVGKIRKI